MRRDCRGSHALGVQGPSRMGQEVTLRAHLQYHHKQGGGLVEGDGRFQTDCFRTPRLTGEGRSYRWAKEQGRPVAQSFFSAAYRFAGSAKAAPLPQWLADSLDDRFEGDLGLIQTTRLAVHQTKVRLTAAAIDAIEHTRGGGQVPLEAVDAALIRSGLETCIGRHAEAWRHLCPREPVPSFAWAFDLHAAGPAEPAFMQCPEPSGPSPVAE